MRHSVTVTIVTYNSENYIRQCLESVFRQNFQPLEVIVVDNASTDATLEFLADFVHRIKLIRNFRNEGFAAAQNQAIAAAQGVPPSLADAIQSQPALILDAPAADAGGKGTAARRTRCQRPSAG